MIDDQINDEDIQSFIKYARRIFGIDIISCQYHEDGISLLKEDKYHEIQAVILDATGFKNESDNIFANNGLRYSLIELDKFSKNRLIPWFVFTGASRNNNDEFRGEIEYFQTNKKFGRRDKVFYLKSIDEDALIYDIIDEINNIKNTTIQYRYKRVFNIALNLNVSEEEITTLSTLINFLEKTEDIKPGIYFTQIRKYVEYVFRALVKLNLLHENCIDKSNGQINLSESSKLLAGLPSKFLKVQCSKTHFPKILADNVKNLVFITGAASHTAEVDETKNMDYQAYYRQIQSPYLLFQLLFTICDLFLWYDQYSKIFNNPEENKSYWVKFETETNIEVSKPTDELISGKVININSQKGFAFFKPDASGDNIIIPPHLVANNSLSEGLCVQVVVEEYIDNRDNEIKKRVKYLKVI